MSKRHIYLVVGSTDYESDDIIQAFLDRGRADSFLHACRTYHAKKPNLSSSDTSFEAYERWEKRYKRWATHHPAGQDNCTNDYFNVSVVPLNTKGQASTTAPRRHPITSHQLQNKAGSRLARRKNPPSQPHPAQDP